MTALFGTNLLLGCIAGITIFLGLPVARWRGASERLRGWLSFMAAGVVMFLVIEVGYHAMEQVEDVARDATVGAAAGMGLLFVSGIAIGLIGLAWLEDRRRQVRAAGGDALEVAGMIAVGIGLHNFAEGLAIGQSFSAGAASLGTILVIGFALHNATEGFGIAGPLAGLPVSWGRLLALGLIGGGPTALGAAVGGVWVNPAVGLLFLSLATGSLIYVTRELFRLDFSLLGGVGVTTALTVGLLLGFGTDLVVGVAGQSEEYEHAGHHRDMTQIRFTPEAAVPSTLRVRRGQDLEVENGGDGALLVEGPGLFEGEVRVPAGGRVRVRVVAAEGTYRLADERGAAPVATVLVGPEG